MKQAGALTIVIVNWNSGPLLRQCLDSIEAAARGVPLVEVVVVDNASSDGSAEGLHTLQGRLRLLRNTTNRGFAAACNQGAAATTESDFILFLNPDTRLFADSLSVPLAHLAASEHAETGIVSIALLGDNGEVQRCCARFPRTSHFACQALGIDRIAPSAGQLMREWDHAATRAVDQVIGAFFLVRRTLFERLGGFDERFFVYFEEVDFALRAQQAGWRSVFFADAQAYHKGGGSSEQVKALRLFYSLRSRLLYAHKHFGAADRLLLRAVTWGLEPLSRAVHLLATRRWAELPALLQAYGMLVRSTESTAKAAAVTLEETIDGRR